MTTTIYLMAAEWEYPNGTREIDPFGVYSDKDETRELICRCLRSFTANGSKLRSFHIYLFELNSTKHRHIVLYWDEALNHTLNGVNPLP